MRIDEYKGCSPSAVPESAYPRRPLRYEAAHQLDGVRRRLELGFLERGAPVLVQGVEVGAAVDRIYDDGVVAETDGGMERTGAAHGVGIHVQAQLDRKPHRVQLGGCGRRAAPRRRRHR